LQEVLVAQYCCSALQVCFSPTLLVRDEPWESRQDFHGELDLAISFLRAFRRFGDHSARSIARRVECSDVCSTAEFILTRPPINIAISQTGHRNSCTFGLAHKRTFISTQSDCFHDIINHTVLYYFAPTYRIILSLEAPNKFGKSIP
jgi:hypothetical protein